MLSSLLRPRKGRRRSDRSLYASPFTSPAINNQEDTDEDPDEQDHGDGEYDDGDYSGSQDDEGEPLLPIFSAAHLGTGTRKTCSLWSLTR